MKKLLLGFVVLCALTFIGCKEDRDSLWGDRGQITINGTTYKVCSFITCDGYWDEEEKMGWFTVTIEEVHNDGIYPIDYDFSFRSDKQLSKGDNLAHLSLRLAHPDNWNYDDLRYSDGDAKVMGFDKNGSEMTIQFNKLKMTDGDVTYIFDGTATVSYDLYPEL